MYFESMESLIGQTCIIIPCRNESGNLVPLVEAIMGILEKGDEICIVEGGSSDSTPYEAETLQRRFPTSVKSIKQDGKGKFNAVLKGIESTKLPIIMIWDADATVNFLQNREIYNYRADDFGLVTGDRLRGERDRGAMQLANLIGNWAFAVAWVPILKQKPIDLLCGTKKFHRILIDNAPGWLLTLDPYGDFTIFAMSQQMSLKIKSIPVHYHARSNGKTNIRRWRGGIELFWITVQIYSKFYRKVAKLNK
jgi:glycosyltransferase involved in cell wall biosynthesis